MLGDADSVETHFVMSSAAKRTLSLETDYSVEQVEALANYVYRPGDIVASISSGSFRAASMIAAPCSIKTVSGISNSYSENLLVRAADVTLKERRPRVLLVRETPLHLGHLRLLVQVADMSAVVMPPMPAFYHRPSNLQDIVDQTVNRALDMLKIDLEHDLFVRWRSPEVGAPRLSSPNIVPNPAKHPQCDHKQVATITERLACDVK